MSHPVDLVESLLPKNEVSIIAGASGAGKTSLVMQLISSLQHSLPFFGMKTANDVKIGYIAADRGGDSLSYWADKTSADLSAISIVSIVKDEWIPLRKLTSDGLGLLTDIVNKMPKIDLLIVDPMIIFFGTDTKNYTANAQCLIHLNRIAAKRGITILGTHHAVKARTDFGFKRPQDRISGTGAFLGYSSTQIFLDTPEESGLPHHSLHIVSHTAPPREIHLVRNEKGLFVTIESEEHKTERIILGAVPISGSISTAEVIAKGVENGLSQRTVELYLNRFTKEGFLFKPSHGKYARAPIGTA